jgi:hypothetical protein
VPAGAIDQAELDGVVLGWGNAALLAASAPEPATPNGCTISLTLVFLFCGLGLTLSALNNKATRP